MTSGPSETGGSRLSVSLVGVLRVKGSSEVFVGCREVLGSDSDVRTGRLSCSSRRDSGLPVGPAVFLVVAVTAEDACLRYHFPPIMVEKPYSIEEMVDCACVEY